MGWPHLGTGKLWGQGNRPSPWLLVLGLVGLTLILLGSWWGREPASPPPAMGEGVPVSATEAGRQIPSDQAALARELEQIIGRIEGAGQVQVSISYQSGPRQQVAENTSQTTRRTEEKEPGGTVRVTTEEQKTVQAVMARPAAGEQPVVLQQEAPQIAGVLVVATGAQDPYVRERVSRAVQTLLGLPPHRVQVCPSR